MAVSKGVLKRPFYNNGGRDEHFNGNIWGSVPGIIVEPDGTGGIHNI